MKIIGILFLFPQKYTNNYFQKNKNKSVLFPQTRLADSHIEEVQKKKKKA